MKIFVSTVFRIVFLVSTNKCTDMVKQRSLIIIIGRLAFLQSTGHKVEFSALITKIKKTFSYSYVSIISL
jgi:hypothetical protein